MVVILVGIGLVRKRNQEICLTKMRFQISDITKELSKKQDALFQPINKQILSQGFYIRLDFTMDNKQSFSACRMYEHGPTRSKCILKFPSKSSRQKTIMEVYSQFEDGSILFSTNSLDDQKYSFPPSVTVQKYSPEDSVETIIDSHTETAYRLNEGGKKVIFNPKEPLFGFLQKRYQERMTHLNSLGLFTKKNQFWTPRFSLKRLFSKP
ncbi:hypothetical protein BVX98_05215 [bacterium F11]|nr:hypothetical protein BVX98_05215 [bacterium F11]